MNSSAIVLKSLELYPDSLEMRLQWRKWTEHLYQARKHILLTGKYPTTSLTVAVENEK